MCICALQFLEAALRAARAEASELATLRDAAARAEKTGAAMATLQASNPRSAPRDLNSVSASMPLAVRVFVHAVYLLAGLLVLAASAVERIASAATRRQG